MGHELGALPPKLDKGITPTVGSRGSEVSSGNSVPQAHTRWRWVVVGVLFATVVAGFFDRISVAVLFTNPGFNQDLGINHDPARFGLLMTVFLLCYAISALLLSFIGDLLQPRRLLAASTGIWGLLMLAMASAASLPVLLFCRGFLGILEGPQFSFITKLIRRWFPAAEHGRANAVWMLGSPVGSAIGFPLLIWLVHDYGWRTTFSVLGLLSLVIIMPLILGLVGDAPRSGAVPVTSKAKFSDLRILLRNRRLWLLSAHNCGVLSYLWGLNSWLPAYLEKARHFNIHQMGFYSSLPFILMLLGELASGYFSDRTGRHALYCIFGMFAAGIFLYTGTQVADPRLAALCIALSAGSWGIGLPVSVALAMRNIPAEVMSTGMGVMNGIGNFAGALVPTIIGMVIAQTGNFGSGLLVVVLLTFICPLALLPFLFSAQKA